MRFPHIYAKNREDAFFALGFVHAQDRLWQMEFQRRVAAGRLSEVLGEATLNTDKFLRTLGIYKAAEASLNYLDAETIAILEAYSRGVNAYLETRSGPLPPEFLILGFKPEPWQPADSLAWSKMMAWDLGSNWDDELLRARLLQVLKPEQVADIFPPYPGDAPVILPDFKGLYDGLDLAGLWRDSPKPLPPGSGSNNWVLSGEHTITGKPLLANDPHLGLQTPSLWYFAHLNSPEMNVIGASLPGVPAILLGRNDYIAWGFTNTGPDTQDLFVERINPQDPSHYLTPDGSEPFIIRLEEIKIKGKTPIVLNVRESRHGPIISDVNTKANEVAVSQDDGTFEHVVAFAWTTLLEDEKTAAAILKLDQAKNWQDFTNALQDFHSPQQNIVYADIEGNIGYYAPARVPVRKSGQGYVPSPGWTGDYDWQGFIPFEALPHSFNPADGRIMTANHKVVPDDYPYFITSEWSEPYRAERINALLDKISKHSPESFARIQQDQLSLMAASFLPFLGTLDLQSAEAREAQVLLLNWDGLMAAERPEGLIFEAWYREFSRLVYEDELGSELFNDVWGFRPLFLSEVIGEKRVWCDDSKTPLRESCQDRASLALENALANLKKSYGEDMKSWQWGKAHIANHDHGVMTNTPLKRLFDLTIPNGGDAFTVNAARFPIDEVGYTQSSGPGYRAIYDFSNLDNSRFIQTTGQSGNPLSLHYRDFLERWRNVDYLPMTTVRADIEKQALGLLKLSPQPP
ncbi:MAG: penicillin acylase family protein [Deinococcales bacterium]